MSLFRKFLRATAFSGLSFLLWGCLEYTITTQVLPDGRILRTVTAKGDSVNIFHGSFRVPSDTGWSVVTRYEPRSSKDSANGEVFVYEATKEFMDFEVLNRIFYTDSAFNTHVNIKVDLHRQHRWFYTYYHYIETYKMLFPFRSVPVSKYLNESELRIYLAGENEVYYSPENDSVVISSDTLARPALSYSDSLRLKEIRDNIDLKYEQWQKINVYIGYFETVQEALLKLGKGSDTAGIRKPFFHWLDSTDVFDEGMTNKDAFINAAARYFGIKAEKLRDANAEGFALFNKKFRVATYTLETYTNRLLMPGVIIKSNGRNISGNLVSWNFKIDTFYASDFVMEAEARSVNKTAVIAAALLLVILLGLFLFRIILPRFGGRAG